MWKSHVVYCLSIRAFVCVRRMFVPYLFVRVCLIYCLPICVINFTHLHVLLLLCVSYVPYIPICVCSCPLCKLHLLCAYLSCVISRAT